MEVGAAAAMLLNSSPDLYAFNGGETETQREHANLTQTQW